MAAALCLIAGARAQEKATGKPPPPAPPLAPQENATAPAETARPWFVNVAKEVGLEGQRAKDCVFTDLNGDGLWDLVLRKRDIYLSRRQGTKFKLHETHGIEFPETTIVTLDGEGKPQTKKAKTGPFVPQYLYFADVDNDGDQDALWGVKAHWEFLDGTTWIRVAEADHGLRSRVYLNDGSGTFARGADSQFTSDKAVGAAMALAIVDVDGDGLLDLFEGREYRQYGELFGCGVDRLWKGDGSGGFADGTEAAGLMTVPEPGGASSSRPSYGVTHADLDNDGDQDLLALSYGRQWNRQWRNEGDGTFVEVGRETMFAGDAITHGRYPAATKKFFKEKYGTERQDEAPFRANGNTFDCAVGDVDNDGDLDLLLGEITHAWAGDSSDLSALLRNERFGFHRETVNDFLPPRPRRGKSWNNGDLHTAMADFDNDGRLDLVIASGDYPDGQFLRLYHQQADGTFIDATEDIGLDWEGCGSISLGDYDRDGDVDILVGRSFARLNQKHRDQFMDGVSVNEVGLLQNRVGNRSGNHFLNVRLVGGGAGAANRSGIGARITVKVGAQTFIREIRCGAGLANHQDPPEACFGLGKAERIDSLTVTWPDAAHSQDVYTDVPVDRFVVVSQGAKELETSKR